MVNFSRWLKLAVFVFFASIGLWFRSSLFGFDSYATLAAVRYGWFDNLAWQPLANIVWGFLPDSLFVFNIIMFLSLFVSIVAVFLLVCLFYDEKLAWVVVFLLMSLSPVLLFGFGEFENEVLAYPFIVWAIYWFFTKDYLKSGVSLFIGIGFWVWFGYFLKGIIGVYNFVFFGILRPAQAIEAYLFSGLINFWLLLPVLFFIPFIENKTVRNLGIVAVVFWLWNSKLFIFLVPFIALSLPLGLAWLEKHTKYSNYLFIIALFCLIGWNIAFVLQSPTQENLSMVKQAVKLSEDTNLVLFNDWSYGYWLWAEGYKTPNNNGSWGEIPLGEKGIYLTSKDLDCFLVSEKKEFARKEMKLWQCN